jgi:hypothetical protein
MLPSILYQEGSVCKKLGPLGKLKENSGAQGRIAIGKKLRRCFIRQDFSAKVNHLDSI